MVTFRLLFGRKVPRENKLYRSSFASIGVGDGFASTSAMVWTDGG